MFLKGGDRDGGLWSLCLQNGFSVAVAAYLLVRMEKRLDELTEAIRRLESAITHIGGGMNSETAS